MTAALPLSYLAGAGNRSARLLEALAWGFSGISVAVVLVVAVLIGLAIRRSRGAVTADHRGDVARAGGGIALVWWGVGLSLPVLAGMAAWNFLVTRALAAPPPLRALTVEVTAHRWWWELRYDDRAGPPVVAAILAYAGLTGSALFTLAGVVQLAALLLLGACLGLPALP